MRFLNIMIIKNAVNLACATREILFYQNAFLRF